MPSNRKPLRVLIQQPVLAPYRDPIFLRLCADPRVEIKFVASDKSLTGEVMNSSAPLPKTMVEFKKMKGGLVWQDGLSKELRSGNFDVVSVGYNPHFLSSIAAAREAKRLGMGVVMWGHGLHSEASGFKTKIYRWMGKTADSLVFYTEDGAKAAIKSGLPSDQVYVAWNSLDTKKIAQFRSPTPFEERYRIICIGRLTEAKKTALALRGFAAAKDGLRKDSVLSIVGDGPCRKHLEALAVELGISSRVEFSGAIYEEEEIAPLMNTSFVSLSPGYVGLSAIHSLAYGVPMIYARDEKHSPEVIALHEGENCLAVPSDDPKSLAEAILQFDKDRGRAEAMGAKGLETVGTLFSVDAMADTLIRAFNDSYVRRNPI